MPPRNAGTCPAQPPVVCQLTTGHRWDDERIFHKQCRTLAANGYAVRLLAPIDQPGTVDGVSLVPIRRPRGRWDRLLRLPFEVFRTAIAQQADCYHFHDPELLPLAVRLRRRGKTVIYDAHENYQAKTIGRLGGRWPAWPRFVGATWWMVERYCAARCSAVVTADRVTARKFPNSRTVVIPNLPPLEFLPERPMPCGSSPVLKAIYVGGVNRPRGVDMAVRAIGLLHRQDVELHILGECRDPSLAAEIEAEPRAVYHGRVDWNELPRYLATADVGLVLYRPNAAFMYYPGENVVKLSEYMAAGIPTIVSRFPGLAEFVEKPGYGVSVDPIDPAAIAARLQTFCEDRNRLREMGARARAAFLDTYNWEHEQPKLLQLYAELTGANGKTSSS